MMNPNQSTYFGTNETTFGRTLGTNERALFNEQIQQQEATNKMSIVGIQKTAEGLIAFADSKATYLENGHPRFDEKRGPIDKIFSNDKFICVSSGSNELVINGEIVFLEAYMKENIKDFTTEEFAVDFASKTIMPSSPVRRSYSFVFGAKDKKGLYIQGCKIADGVISWQPKNYGFGMIFSGADQYVRILENTPEQSILPIRTHEKLIKRQIELLIEYFDLFSNYNPVGCPVHTKVFMP